VLNNLKAGENKFFFKCQDNPNQNNSTAKPRNTNENAKQYLVNVCATGLNITSLSPQNEIVSGKSPVAVELKATTSGCVSNGKSECSFKFNNLGTNASDIYVNFLNTNANTHSQLITSMPSGDNNISVKCVDDAGNSDQKTIEVQVDIDNSAPVVLRNYLLNKKLIIVTNENSQCAFTKNSSIGCAFTFADNVTLMAGTGKSHDTESKENENYYIKCKDGFNNEDASCSIVIKTY